MMKRIGVSILLVWIVSSVVFLAIHLVPGDPAELLLSSGGVAPDPAAVEALQRRLGLDQPIAVQYANAFMRLLQGDIGRSMKDNSSIAEAIMRRLPRTLELITAAGFMGILIGLPAGTLAAIRRGDLGTGAAGIQQMRVTLHESHIASASFEGPLRGSA